MTKIEWDVVEGRLRNVYHPVKLNCDGFIVGLSLVQLTIYRNVISILSVNGCFMGKWILEDCEERRRFLRPRVTSVFDYLRKDRRISKKLLKTVGVDPGKKFTSYWPYWTSFSSLKRHLIANNESIMLIDQSHIVES